jgi:hypothetical protein
MFLKVSSIYLLFYLLYVQFSSKIGGIWLRPNDKGQIVFSFQGLTTMLFCPFSNLRMWYPDVWDLNYFMGTTIVYSFLRLTNNLLQNL